MGLRLHRDMHCKCEEVLIARYKRAQVGLRSYSFFILKDWTNDIPSLYHAVLIRKGKEIKRHKLFNG